MNWWRAALGSKMNTSGVLPPEKMELDLEIPSSLVQTDGHLRRSNSAPMINGLRFLQYDIVTLIYCIMFHWMCLSFCHTCWYITLTSWAADTWHMVEFVIPVITPKCSRERSCVVGEIALQLSTGPTWYNTLLNTFTQVMCDLFLIECSLLHTHPSLQVPSSPIRVPSTRLHQIKQVRKGRSLTCLEMFHVGKEACQTTVSLSSHREWWCLKNMLERQFGVHRAIDLTGLINW